MGQSTGYILAAAGIVIANELVFAPVVAHEPLFSNFNWRILPATAIAVASLAGLEALSPPLGKGLAILALLAVLIRPVGNAPSPVENAAKFVGVK